MPLPLAALAVAGGASLVGSGIQAYGQKKAAEAAAQAQIEAARINAETAAKGLEATKGAVQPYTESSTGAMQGLKDLSASGQYDRTGAYTGANQFDPSTVDVNKDPGVAYRLEQSQKALDTSASGKGALFSGAQQKALQENAQNLASQEYQKAYDRDKGTFTSNFDMGNKVFLDQQAQANLQQGRKTADTQFMANQGLNAAGLVANATGANTTQQIGATNQLFGGQGVQNSAGDLALANMGGTLSSAGLDIGKMMIPTK
jgi:hypothetical protein